MGPRRAEELSVEIKVDLALVNAKAPLKALADVLLRWSEGELTIRRCPVFQKSGEPPWANLPRLPIDKNGQKQFVPLIDLSRELKQRVLDAMLIEYGRKTDAR
jgi:hypothetical protein